MSPEDPNLPETTDAAPTASLYTSKIKGAEQKKKSYYRGTPSIEQEPLLGSPSPEVHQSASKSNASASTSPNSKASKDTQKVEWCDCEEQQTQRDNFDEEPILTMILNSLMFCGLVITPDVLWTFPRQVIEYGGVYFIFIYFFMLFLIAFPLLHMEIFVGQRCQSGIIKTTRMYGYGFECLGIGIFCFTLIKSLPGVQDSYILIRHLINIFVDAEGIMSCEYDEYKGEIDSAHCVSLVDDMNCPRGQVYYGKCTNTSILPSIMGIIVSVKDHYSNKMRRIRNPDFDFERLLYNILVYGLVTVISIFGFKAVRILLIFVYCCFIVIFISMAYYFLSLGGSFSYVLHELYIFSTPECIFHLDTYVKALDLSLVTTGIGLSGLLCASSFRPRRGNSFALTYVIIISNVIVCFLSLLYALGMLQVASFGSDATRTPTVEALDFILGTITELFVAQRRSRLWHSLYNITIILVNIKSFCGPLIMVYAFVRDHVRGHHRMWNVVAVAVFSAVCFTLSVFRSLPTVNEKYGILASDLSSSVIYLIVAALVVIFVHLYGEREYLIDLCELYTLKEKENPFMSPTYSRQFVVFDAVPFAFLIAHLFSTANVHPFSFLEGFWSEVAGYFLAALIGVIFICCFTRILYECIRKSDWWMTLFVVTPEHPSFKRISSGRDSSKRRQSETTPSGAVV